jgi:hypothetical protein
MAASARGSAKTVVVCPLIFMMDLLVSMRELSLMKNKTDLLPFFIPSPISFLHLLSLAL